jgi:hypothetical protein
MAPCLKVIDNYDQRRIPDQLICVNADIFPKGEESHRLRRREDAILLEQGARLNHL